MAWQGIEGHDEVVERFRRALARRRLASSFLFVGPGGVGKRLFAEKLAQVLLCQRAPAERMEPCGECDSCRQVMAGTHPDLHVVTKPADKSFIPLSAFLGDDEHRMREGLCHDIALKPFAGARKVALVDDADYLNEESANALLKTLEEPPPGSVLILIGTAADRQLPTIRSRCQLVRFARLDTAAVSRILMARGLADDPQQAERMAETSGGSVARAVDLRDEELSDFQQQLLDELARPVLASVSLAQATCAFVDGAGKEASARRARARQVLQVAADFYRELLRVQTGLPAGGNSQQRPAVERARAAFGDALEMTTACIDRTLTAIGHVDRNAHQATLIEGWLDDLARIQSHEPVAPYDE